MEHVERRGRGRPRSQDVHDALLAGTRGLLLEVGYPALTVDAVAKRVGGSKTAIYRRWSGKAELVVEAVSEHLTPVGRLPDTGSLREDLLACGRAYVRDPESHRLLVAVIVAMAQDADLRAIAGAHIGDLHRNAFRDVVARGVSRGLLSDDTDTEVVADILPALAFRHVVVVGTPIDKDLVVRWVDGCVLRALPVLP